LPTAAQTLHQQQRLVALLMVLGLLLHLQVLAPLAKCLPLLAQARLLGLRFPCCLLKQAMPVNFYTAMGQLPVGKLQLCRELRLPMLQLLQVV
jgi:hypothetical protein